MKCRKCKLEFNPTNNQFKKRDFICVNCRHEYDREWRKKRRSLGLSTGGIASKEWTKNYIKEYYKRPEVKARIRLWSKDYFKKPENKLLMSVRRITRWAVQSGKINKTPCVTCGNIRSEAHHLDYCDPLNVIWLCSKHHKEYHNRGRL